MKNNFKRFVVNFTIMWLLIGITGNSYAHSGRTDSNGGHKDNQNKSGLGSYHYHCGGHPAHLHDGGVCPYSATPASYSEHSVPTSQSSVSTSTSKSTSSESVATSSRVENAPKTIIEVSSVEINENIESMKVGETNQLTVTVLPENAENKNVTWKSTNEDIVTVSSTGKIAALGTGAVNISATTSNGKTDLILIDVEGIEEKEEEIEVVATSIQSDDFDNTISNSSENEDVGSGILGLVAIGGGIWAYKKIKKSRKKS